jgi:hypothetical protein
MSLEGNQIKNLQDPTENQDAVTLAYLTQFQGETGITTAQANAIIANTAKTSMVLGTTASTALAGNTTTITSDQASAITANTAKVGITSDQADAIVANTAKVGITTAQANAIIANTSKTSMVLGTTASTALAGNTATITSDQASAITANTLKVSYTQPIYSVNTFYAELGGYVIQISPNGKHGLVVAMQDQGMSSWYEANNLLSNPSNHDLDGKEFSDWRIPTKRELNLMYVDYTNGNGASLNANNYWSSTEEGYEWAWRQRFSDGAQDSHIKFNGYIVRAVRAF